jgi:hypothetical protein
MEPTTSVEETFHTSTSSDEEIATATIPPATDRTEPELPGSATTEPRSKGRKTKPLEGDIAPPDTPSPTTNKPIDFSQIVVRINAELKRLNWSREQGRDCMIQLYNKKSSSLLTNEELLDFLAHLEGIGVE